MSADAQTQECMLCKKIVCDEVNKESDPGLLQKTSTKEHHSCTKDNHQLYPEMIRYNETGHRLELCLPERNDKIQ